MCIVVLWLKLNYYSWIRAVRIRKVKALNRNCYIFLVNIHAKIIMEPFDDLMALGLDDWMKFVIYCQIGCFFHFCSVQCYTLYFISFDKMKFQFYSSEIDWTCVLKCLISIQRVEIECIYFILLHRSVLPQLYRCAALCQHMNLSNGYSISTRCFNLDLTLSNKWRIA